MNKLTVRAKLIFAFVCIVGMIIVISLLAIQKIGAANDRFSSYVYGIRERSNVAHMMREAVDLRAIAARNLVLVTRPEDVALEKAVVTKAHQSVGEDLQKLKTLAQAPGVPQEVRDRIDMIDKIEQQYAPVALRIVDMALNRKTDEAVADINNNCRPLLAALIKATDDYNSFTEARSEAAIATAQAEFVSNRRALILGCVLVILVASIAGFLITQAIIGPLNNAVGIVTHVAGGDLSTTIAVSTQDEFGLLLAALKNMQESLSRVVSNVRQGADVLSVASSQIASGNQDLGLGA